MQINLEEYKGQIHTIEAFTAAFIILFSLIFSIQSIGITPTSSSTASQVVEKQNYKLVDDILSQSKANGELKEALLNWNNTTDRTRFGGTPENISFYSGRREATVPDNGTEPGLNGTLQVLHNRGIAHNINIICNGRSHRFVYNGQPSKHSVTAYTTIVLLEQDKVDIWDNGIEQSMDDKYITEIVGYPCRDKLSNNHLYSVVQVEIVAWRM